MEVWTSMRKLVAPSVDDVPSPFDILRSQYLEPPAQDVGAFGFEGHPMLGLTCSLDIRPTWPRSTRWRKPYIYWWMFHRGSKKMAATLKTLQINVPGWISWPWILAADIDVTNCSVGGRKLQTHQTQWKKGSFVLDLNCHKFILILFDYNLRNFRLSQLDSGVDSRLHSNDTSPASWIVWKAQSGSRVPGSVSEPPDGKSLAAAHSRCWASCLHGLNLGILLGLQRVEHLEGLLVEVLEFLEETTLLGQRHIDLTLGFGLGHRWLPTTLWWLVSKGRLQRRIGHWNRGAFEFGTFDLHLDIVQELTMTCLPGTSVVLNHPHDPSLVVGPDVEVTVSSMLRSEIDLALLQFVDRHVREVW